jgi:hypothetical protein
MAISPGDYKEGLISKIHSATSQDEVKRIMDTAMKALQENKVNGHIIIRFVDKLMSALDSCSPIQKDAQQWSNIRMARILLNRIKLQLNAPPIKL